MKLKLYLAFLALICGILAGSLGSSLAVSNHRQIMLEQRRAQVVQLQSEIVALKEQLRANQSPQPQEK